MKKDANVWRRFDRIVAIGCEKYMKRQQPLRQELSRVGMLPLVTFSIDYEDPFIDKLNDSLPFTCQDTKRYFRCNYNHFRNLLAAYKEGCSSILMIEDDIVFLKDIDALHSMVRDLPEDFDLAMFDKNICKQSYMEMYEGKSGWQPIYGRFNSSGCYAMSHLCMGRFLRAYQQGRCGRLTNNDLLFTDTDLGEDIKRYATFPNLAIQRVDCHSMCASMAEYWLNQRRWGTDMEKYNISIQDAAKEIFDAAKPGESINEVLDRILAEKPQQRQNTYRTYMGRRRVASIQSPKPKHVAIPLGSTLRSRGFVGSGARDGWKW